MNNFELMVSSRTTLMSVKAGARAIIYVTMKSDEVPSSGIQEIIRIIPICASCHFHCHGHRTDDPLKKGLDVMM